MFIHNKYLKTENVSTVLKMFATRFIKLYQNLSSTNILI